MIKLRFSVPSTQRSFSFCHVAYAGHNKWSKIQQKKGAKDAQRSVVFGKAARDIVVAARNGGSVDPTKNLQLAVVLRRARDMNVPKENIEKALSKANRVKEHGGNTFVYEALAYSSVGLLVECVTDNSNRTIHNLREILNGHGARATPVKFMFRRMGYLKVKRIAETLEGGGTQTEELIEAALSSGAIDFGDATGTDDRVSVWLTCELDDLSILASSISERFGANWEFDVNEARYLPQDQSEGISREAREGLKALIEELEANEDVLQVWSTISR